MKTSAVALRLRIVSWESIMVISCFFCLSLPVIALIEEYTSGTANGFDDKSLLCFPTQKSKSDAWQGLDRSDEALRLHVPSQILDDQLRHNKFMAAKNAQLECADSYGFLPCSTNIGGNLFLLVVYGFLLLQAAKLMSNGSEQLLTVLEPGVIGGLILPILGALPDALLILVSGLAASRDQAQAQVLVGMGLLAGSTVMLLTLLWGSSLIVGRCDLYEVDGHLNAKERTLTKGLNLIDTGVTTDSQTRVAAWIMVLTVIPYILPQLPRIIKKPSLGTPLVVLSCVLAFVALLCYCVYQILSPWIQQRRIYRARYRFRKAHTLHRASLLSREKKWGNLLTDDGAPNKHVISKLFGYFDKNDDDSLSKEELRGLIVGLGISHKQYLPEEQEVQHWLRDFDVDINGCISQKEFCEGLEKWIKSFKPRSCSVNDGSTNANSEPWDVEHAQASLASLLEDPDDEEEDEPAHQLSKVQIVAHAILLIVGGTLLAAVFADPLVDAIDNFSKASGIPNFFISFVATPLATTSSEAISSLMFATRRRKRYISMTCSQIYGAVAMNNTLCLGIFLAIVAARGLIWDFSAEVTVIFFVIIVIGLFAGLRTTFQAWMAVVALSLYPIAIAIVAVLDYVFHWH
ncbi:hypothetical protein O6H91_Y577200 [Diphasiastrum complanatum]|nr:hypothetical protein O6H91_Y577200 [Diphasiastrum complanatum]KAJ7298460.1 hypothetical protein O6H91_Y577200 [Diphasiastrum complanatum]